MWSDFTDFLTDNPVIVGLIGVLIGAGLNAGAARALHRDRVPCEVKTARRVLYGRSVAAIEERRSLDAALYLSTSRALSPERSATTVKHWKQMRTNPETARTAETLSDIDFRRREADKRASAIKFEILIDRGGADDKEVKSAMAGLRGADGHKEYADALKVFHAFCVWG